MIANKDQDVQNKIEMRAEMPCGMESVAPREKQEKRTKVAETRILRDSLDIRRKDKNRNESAREKMKVLELDGKLRGWDSTNTAWAVKKGRGVLWKKASGTKHMDKEGQKTKEEVGAMCKKRVNVDYI